MIKHHARAIYFSTKTTQKDTYARKEGSAPPKWTLVVLSVKEGPVLFGATTPKNGFRLMELLLLLPSL